VMAVGRPGWLMGFSALQLCLLAAGLYPLTSRWGIHGAAIAVTSTALIAAAAALAAAVRITGSNGRRTLTLITVPLGASMAMAAGIILLKRLMGTVGLLGFVLLVAAGVGLYAACLAGADAALTSGRYKCLAADLLAGLRASGKNGVTPLSERAGGSAAALRADDPLR
jgi:O-antigen/teichoic acid export membrane protein